MRSLLRELSELVCPDFQRDRVVPGTGFTARLTSFTAGAMAFLVVFALALSLAADRLGQRWSAALAQTATVRISAPADQVEAQVASVLDILNTTPGIQAARSLTADEQQNLLQPWFGADLPLGDLPIPRLIDITETETGFDADGVRLRLRAEAPGAVLDDHARWRKPLVQAAGRLSWLAILCIGVIGLTTAAMVILAARAALAANAQVITVLRLIGAKDHYIAAAFVRRFTMRAFVGASIGVALAALALFALPGAGDHVAVLSGLRFQGIEWAVLIVVPPILALVALLATRYAAMRVLEGLS